VTIKDDFEPELESPQVIIHDHAAAAGNQILNLYDSFSRRLIAK